MNSLEAYNSAIAAQGRQPTDDERENFQELLDQLRSLGNEIGAMEAGLQADAPPAVRRNLPRLRVQHLDRRNPQVESLDQRDRQQDQLSRPTKTFMRTARNRPVPWKSFSSA